MHCVICGIEAVPHLAPWLLRCAGCGLRLSRLGEAAFNGAHTSGWDAATAAAMRGVREQAADALLDRLQNGIIAPAGTLLDVGCGPGWFVAAAAARGYAAAGIEPDAAVGEHARAAGLNVITGLFPLENGYPPVDILTFNDVFEHLPQPAAALAAVRAQLKNDGVLVLNLPNANGVYYRVAEWLARIGIAAPLERMWQRGFDSPHLFYYTPANLDRLLAAHGFTRIARFDLNALALAGLWGRIRAGGNFKLPASALIYLATVAILPLLAILPSDIMVHSYRRS